jgi:hypothetical protein
MTKKLKAHVIPAKAGIQTLDRYRIYADMYLVPGQSFVAQPYEI